MQFVVTKAATKGKPVPYNLANLQAQLPAAFIESQPTPIVPEVAYGAANNTYSRIQDTSLDINSGTVQMGPKAIQELFELNYGRMNATLGVELPFTNFNTQTTIPYGYIDPVTEITDRTAKPRSGRSPITALTPMPYTSTCSTCS